MSAPTGNKYAEKWTLERTLESLRIIDTYSYSSDCIYLGHALSGAGLYQDVWNYWRRKWHRRHEIISMMKRIMQRFEVRIFDKMAKKEMPANVGMFALKHHYGWGKEPDPHATPVDLIDEDKELIPEPQETVVETETAATETNPAPLPEIITETLATQQGRDLNKLFIEKYNQANPGTPITTLAAYYHGTPPAGVPVTLFGSGYFITANI